MRFQLSEASIKKQCTLQPDPERVYGGKNPIFDPKDEQSSHQG